MRPSAQTICSALLSGSPMHSNGKTKSSGCPSADALRSQASVAGIWNFFARLPVGSLAEKNTSSSKTGRQPAALGLGARDRNSWSTELRSASWREKIVTSTSQLSGALSNLQRNFKKQNLKASSAAAQRRKFGSPRKKMERAMWISWWSLGTVPSQHKSEGWQVLSV